jgi:glycosyltransferase involved in cell wall biosynthesis
MAMRVLHCIHSLEGGGAERQLKLLAESSARHGMEAAILCVNASGNDIVDSSVSVYTTARCNKYNFSIFPALKAAIGRFSPDILHAWLPISVTVPALLAAARHRLPVVFSYRNRMSLDSARALAEFVFVVALAEGVAANNPVVDSGPAYRWLYRLKHSATIPNAVDTRGFYKSAHWLGDRPLRVLFVGRLTRQKNLECLLQAIAAIDDVPSVELTVCGDGEDRAQIEYRIRELGIGARTSLLGVRADIYRIMSEHDLLVLPSWWEGMPNVLLEALAIGLPCVVSDIPAHRRLVAGCARLFDPVSPPQLVKEILCLRGSPEGMRRMVDAGREVAARYTIDAMASEYRQYYDSLLRQSPRPAGVA